MGKRLIKALIRRCIIFAIILLIVYAIVNDITYTEVKDSIMKKIYKTDYTEYVQKYSIEYDVDKYLIFAIIKAESNFKTDAKSNKSAKGLMQIMDSTAQEVALEVGIDLTKQDIYTPEVNINLGTKYISDLIQKYNNVELALAAYNAGSGNVDSWISLELIKPDGSDIEKIPYSETNNYVRKILRDRDIYSELYGGNNK